MDELREAINNLDFAISILCIVTGARCAVMIYEFVVDIKKTNVSKWRWTK
jgi:hypothetical protein